MPTISTHLPEATYKQLRARIGRKQKPSAFVRAAIEEKLAASSAGGSTPAVQRIAEHVHAMLEDELDIRIADERMARIERGQIKALKGKDVWSELGL